MTDVDRSSASTADTTGTTRHAVVLGPDARALRSAVGPVAWIVLEDLVMCSAPIDGRIVTRTTVRSVAASLGLSKDTVAAGLRRLTERGIVRRQDNRDQSSGCFTESVYVVDLEGTGLSLCSTSGLPPDPEIPDTVTAEALEATNDDDRPGPPSRRHRRARRSSAAGADQADQLSLLDPSLASHAPERA